MKAQFVFEKFSEEDDPIHSMGIGTPLSIAGGYLQKYADAHGYEFQMVPIRKQESPIMFVDIKPYFEVLTNHEGGAAVYVYKHKYTITYMPHQAPNIYSLRKEWVGYARKLKRGDNLPLFSTDKYEDNFKLRELKQDMKAGNAKECDVKQNLMGRYRKDQMPDIIQRIDTNIKKEVK